MNNSYDPYDIWKKQIITWLLCHKHNSLIAKCVDINIAKKISMYVPIDLTDWCEWDGETALMHLQVWYRGPYEWIWTVENRVHGRSPCLICLRPCVENPEPVEYGDDATCEQFCQRKGKHCSASKHFRKFIDYCRKHGYQNTEMIKSIGSNCEHCGIFGICKDQCFDNVTTRIVCETEILFITDSKFLQSGKRAHWYDYNNYYNNE